MARFENWNRQEETRNALYDRAVFCIRTGVQPSEYDRMTDDELQAFVDAWNDEHRSN